MEPTLTTRWFYKNLAQGEVQAGKYVCCVCGLPCADAVLRKKVLRNTFTDYDVLRVRTGQEVCPACAWYFGRQDLRRSGWWLSREQALQVRKSEWLSLLQSHVRQGAPVDAYYLVKPLGLTGKHLALYAPLVMAGSTELVVQFDTLRVKVHADFMRLVEASHRLREFHSWKEIRDGNYYANHILAWPDRAEFINLRKLVDRWRGTAELALAEFLWSKEN